VLDAKEDVDSMMMREVELIGKEKRERYGRSCG